MNSWLAIETCNGVPYFMEACLRQVLGWSRSTFTILLRLFLRAKINGVEKSLSMELRN